MSNAEDIIDRIRHRHAEMLLEQKPRSLKKLLKPLKHQPGVLYIGCIDARLDPIANIGFEIGEAVVPRRFGAVVQKPGEDTDLGASLEAFLYRFPSKDGLKKKHIIVAGHTHCGAMQACYHGEYSEHEPEMKKLLEGNLTEARDRILAKADVGNWNDDKALRELEKESVRQGVSRIMQFPGVQEAVRAGTLEVDGWVLNTADKTIYEMNHKTKEFSPLGEALVAVGKGH